MQEPEKTTSHDQAKAGKTGNIIKDGFAGAWPICLGYIPIGLAFGVLARQNGLEWWAVAMMSVLVFAGSAQFIAVAMLAGGASAAAIIFTTFVVNLRHTLMSSALAVYFTGVRRMFLALFAYGITDESFAVNRSCFQAGTWDRWRALTVNQLANFTWICATVTGALAGQLVSPGAYGIDFALTAMFICLLAIQVYGWIHVITALIAAAISIAWYIAIPGNTYIVGASVCAATAGYFIKQRMKRGV